jgi:hypothetical protein
MRLPKPARALVFALLVGSLALPAPALAPLDGDGEPDVASATAAPAAESSWIDELGDGFASVWEFLVSVFLDDDPLAQGAGIDPDG